VLLTLALVNSMWIFLSASRGGFMVMSICMLYILVTLRNVKLLLYMLIPLSIIGVIIATQFADQQAYTIHRITKTFDDSYSAAGRTSGRSDLALGGWYIFIDNPLGVGTGGFSQAWINLDMREGISGFKRGERAQAHTAWIKTLSENGIPGIILMTAFVFSFAIIGLGHQNRDLMWLGILTTVCLSAAFLATEFRSKGLWFLAAGSAVLLNRDIIVAHLRGSLQRTPILSIVNPKLTQRHE
jgi:O-antigen ligase